MTITDPLTIAPPTSVFARFQSKVWAHRFATTIRVGTLVGGTPTDPRVAEGWLKSRMSSAGDVLLAQVAETMAQRHGIEGTEADAAEIAAEVAIAAKLNGFKRDDRGIYIEGRQVKAAIKEAAMVAAGAGNIKAGTGWGETRKGLKGFVAEHIHVAEDRIYLTRNGLTLPEADGIQQRFVHTSGPKGPQTGISYEEFGLDVDLAFTVEADWKFTDEFWGTLWVTGEKQGIGAVRAQSFGRYIVTEWRSL
jgi:hypothetical protein